MRKLKICIVGNDYKQQFPLLDYGGIESTVENTAIGLNQYYKNDVSVCAIVPKILKNKRDYGFTIIETNEVESSISNKPSYAFAEDVRKIISNTSTRPDIIWSQSDWSARVLKDLNIPIICTSQDSATNEGTLKKHGDYKYIASPNVYYRFVSKYLLDNNFDLTDKRQSDIYTHSFYQYTGLTDDNYKLYPNKQNYVLWVAGLNWENNAKGLDDFITLSKMNPDIDFICYGTGNYDVSNKLIELTKTIKNFYYKGVLHQGLEHQETFGNAKFFMFLSRISEAFGRTGVEAISKGTPIIGYDSGAIPELYQYDNVGYITQKDNFDAISKELHKEYDYRKCYEFSKKYHIKNELNSLLGISDIILNTGKI